MTKNRESALALAAGGWRVHPLRPGTKLPMLAAWQNVASSEPDTVAAWWTNTPAAGIGLATGHCGVFVLDVDTANGKAGEASLAALTAQYGPLPETLSAKTATGGLHLYFAAAEPVRNSAGKLGAGLDVRGSGGYVVAPPTVIDGRTYEWRSLAPVAAAPVWLVSLAVAAAPAASTSATIPVAVEPTAELLADLRSALGVLNADDRDVWIATAGALRVLGEAGHALWLEWSQASDKYRLGDEEVFYTVGTDRTGPAAIFAKAQAAGWQNPRAAQSVDPASVGFGGHPLPPGASAPSGPALRLVPVHDVMTATVPPPRFTVAPLIPAGHLTLFGSHGGAGKSILTLAICAHVAAGTPWAGFAVERRPVLFISLEDGGEIVRHRLRKVIEAYRLDAAAVAVNLSIVDGSAGFTALMTERVAFGTRQLEPTATLVELRAMVGNAGLIVIDNASDAFGGNENDRQQVRTFIRTLAALGCANQAGVLLLAHVDKAAAKFGAAGNSYSGSSAWHNSARSRLALVSTRDGVELVQEKLNLGRAAGAVRLRWTSEGVLIPDQSVAARASISDADSVLAAIAAAIKDGVNVSTARSGPATTQNLLENLPDLPPHLRGRRGREDFWNAITDLQRSGRIKVEEYQAAGRHMRERFILPAPVTLVAPIPTISATSELQREPAPVAPVPRARGVGIYGAHEIGAAGGDP